MTHSWGFKIRGHSIFFHNSYRILPFRWYWNSWIGPSTKTTKIGTPRNLSHPQYSDIRIGQAMLHPAESELRSDG